MKQETMTVQEYREYLAKEAKKKSKYNNQKTVVDGIEFDSAREAERYGELKILEKYRIISDLELQPEFVLQKGFYKNGKKHRPIKYIADFKYKIVETGETVVEDVKGVKTQVFRMKQKMFEEKYPDLSLKLIN
jgi:hypothetical protein